MLSDVWERRLSFLVLMLLAAQAVVATLWYGGVSGIAQSVLLLLASGTVILWVVLAAGKPSKITAWPVLGWLVASALVYVTYRYRTAELEYVARREWLMFLAAGSQFLVGVDLFSRQPEYRRLIVYLLLGLVSVVGFLAFYQFFGEHPTVWGAARPAQYGMRGSGTFINPNHFAASLELILFPSLALLLLGRLGVLGRLFVGYAVLVLAGGILVSASRGAYVATTVTFLSFLCFLLCLRQKRRLAFVLLAGWLLAGSALVIKSREVRTRLVHITKVAEGSDDEARLKIWRSAWSVFREQPIWGVGPGHFEFRYFKYRSPHYQQSAVHAHNDLLNLLVDYGIVGGLLILAIGIALLADAGCKLWQFIRSASASGKGRLPGTVVALGAAFGLLALALHGLVDFLIYIPALAAGAAVLVACVGAPYLDGSRREGGGAAKVLRGLQVALMVAVAIAMGGYGARLFQESSHLRRGRSPDLPSEARLEQVRLAALIEPANDWPHFWLGDHYRQLSALGGEHWEEEARTALQHLEAASQLNPYRYDTWLRTGYCLDWLGRHDEAGRAFEKAQSLDPNGATTMAWVGWHWFQVEQYQAAIDQFARSLNHLPAERNALATTYLPLALERLKARR